MEHILKIKDNFWNDIESGKKKVEIRKLNKKHIKANDTICFVNLASTEVFGRAKVMSNTVMKKESVLQYKELGIETIEFIKFEYICESELMFIVVEPIDSEKAFKLEMVQFLDADVDGVYTAFEVVTDALHGSEINELIDRLTDYAS